MALCIPSFADFTRKKWRRCSRNDDDRLQPEPQLPPSVRLRGDLEGLRGLRPGRELGGHVQRRGVATSEGHVRALNVFQRLNCRHSFLFSMHMPWHCLIEMDAEKAARARFVCMHHHRTSAK